VATSNFPFQSTDDFSRDLILKALPEWNEAETLIDRYETTIHAVYQIIHMPTFRAEVREFYNKPTNSAVRISWIALLAMVLGIGSRISESQLGGLEDTSSQLLEAAQMCLFSTPYLSRPSIANLQTLFLMVVAKQIRSMSCSESDGCWAVNGLLIRLGFGTGLDRSCSSDYSATIDDSVRENLWLGICMLEMRQSFTSAMPSMITPRHLYYNVLPIINSDGNFGIIFGKPALQSADDRWRELWATAIWQIAQVVDDNDPNRRHPDYDEILSLDQQIRQTLRAAEDHCTQTSQGQNDTKLVLLQTSLRRALLSLHYPYAVNDGSVLERPTSYWSSLECALAILMEQDRLCGSTARHIQMRWLSDLLKEDFFTAAATLGYHLLQGAPVEAGADFGMIAHPRDTILETLRSCLEIWKRERTRSSCQGQAHEAFSLLLKCIEENHPHDCGS
jgi:hypothetical protein